MIRTIAAFLLMAAMLATGSVAKADIDFFIVDQGEENKQAAVLLRDYLNDHDADVGLPVSLKYEEVIRRLAGWNKQGDYLAHMTPYAFVAAEMLGAKFEVLATTRGESTQGNTTYHSYFVVDKNRFQENLGLEQLPAYLDGMDSTPEFIYHSKFSTSSFFLPSIFLRSKRIFETQLDLVGLIGISVSQIDINSSSALVRAVANGEADLAAVWDGTKSKFEEGSEGWAEFGSKVRFLQLPTPLPNDLLVVSESLPEEEKTRIRNAIAAMPDDLIAMADIRTWVDIDDAANAREALSSLRRIALEPPAPVTVKVESKNGNYGQITQGEIDEAARQAVRLSSTELVLHDEFFHKNPPDIDWVLSPIHDGAVNLTANISDSGVPKQEYTISFSDSADLTRRIGSLIHSRLHRIRFIWPYMDQDPTIIRDFDFAIKEGAKLRAQGITWTNYDKHEFIEGGYFDTTVESSDFFKLRLSNDGFPTTGSNSLDFSAMSNEAWRVVLVRPSIERPFFKALTAIFVIIIVGAAVVAVYDATRTIKLKPGPDTSAAGIVAESRRLARRDHQVWENRTITDAHVISCDRKRVNEFISELKRKGIVVPFDYRMTYEKKKSLTARIPIIGKWISASGSVSEAEVYVVDAGSVGDAARLDDLIGFLVREDMLTAFNGSASGWDALNAIANRTLSGAGESDQHSGPSVEVVLRPDNPHVVKQVSAQFVRILDDTEKIPAFFSHDWTISDGSDGSDGSDKVRLSKSVDLPGDIQFNGNSIDRLTLEIDVPKQDSEHAGLQPDSTYRAWVFGKLVGRKLETNEGKSRLSLHFRRIAVLKDVRDSP